MLSEDLLKLLSGTSAVAKNSSKMLEEKLATIIEEKILKGTYVKREEYDKLKKLVEKLEKQIVAKKS